MATLRHLGGKEVAHQVFFQQISESRGRDRLTEEGTALPVAAEGGEAMRVVDRDDPTGAEVEVETARHIGNRSEKSIVDRPTSGDDRASRPEFVDRPQEFEIGQIVESHLGTSGSKVGE